MMENDNIDDINFANCKIDINWFKDHIAEYDMTKLSDIVICYRYLGFNAEMAKIAMEELGTRRAAGDSFAFEKYIEDSLKDLPNLNLPHVDLRSILQRIL